ncbi:MAG: hypothetical protein J5517_00045 [Eubacterium sp.]|nr:hypothetical protein [Eubacterium sp.]
MKSFKKALCVTLAIGLILSMAGCGKNNGSNKGKGKGGLGGDSKISDAKDTSTDDVFREDPDFSIGETKGWISNLEIRGDKIYFYSDEWIEESSGTDAEVGEIIGSATESDAYNYNPSGYDIIRFYSMPVEGGDAEQIAELKTEDNFYMDRFFVDKDGNFLVNMTKWTSDDRNVSKLYRLENGELTDEKDISAITDVSGDSWLSNFYMNEDGSFIAIYDKEIKIFDKNLKETASAKLDEYIESSGLSKDGNVIVGQSTYENDKVDTKVKIFDVKTGKFTEEYPVEVQYLNSISEGYGDYDFFYQTNSGVYGYKFSDKSQTKIMDFSKSDMDSNYVGTVTVVDENTIYSIGYGDEDNYIAKYVRVDPSEIADRTILTIMTLYSDYDLKQRVVDYNKSQSKYRINLVDYSEEEDPAAKMSAEIASGNLPDMYSMYGSIGNMSIDQCISKGMFLDLTDLIEKDSDISMDDFIPSVAEAMKKDGKIYTVSPSFTVTTLLAKKSEVGDTPGWTFDEFKKYVDSKDKDAMLFWSNNKMDMLREFMYYCSGEFIDWQKGEVYFDSPEFKNVLEICNRGTNEEMNYDEETDSEPTRIRNGKLIFVEGTMVPEQVQMYNEIYQKDLCFKGYPTKNGSGSYVTFSTQLAISSKSEHQDECWAFLRDLMTEEYQGKLLSNSWEVPTRKDAFEVYLENQKVTKETTDKYGNTIYPHEGSYGWEDFEIESKPLTDEELQIFRDLVDSVSGQMEYNDNVVDIIAEEAEAYFKGDKSVDEVASIIQNRANTYVNENK